MRIFVFTAIAFLSMACNNNAANLEAKNDSLNGMSEEEFKTNFIDSFKKASLEKAVRENLSKSNSSPVKVLTSFVSKNSIGTPEANVDLTNKSKKLVDGVKVGIYCYNNFDEPVTGSIIGDNEFRGISQETLKPGKSEFYSWSLSQYDLTTKIKPYVYEVHFTDGTSWKLKP